MGQHRTVEARRVRERRGCKTHKSMGYHGGEGNPGRKKGWRQVGALGSGGGAPWGSHHHCRIRVWPGTGLFIITRWLFSAIASIADSRSRPSTTRRFEPIGLFDNSWPNSQPTSDVSFRPADSRCRENVGYHHHQLYHEIEILTELEQLCELIIDSCSCV